MVCNKNGAFGGIRARVRVNSVLLQKLWPGLLLLLVVVVVVGMVVQWVQWAQWFPVSFSVVGSLSWMVNANSFHNIKI